MTDDPKKHKQDAKLISLAQAHERKYWTRRLGVTTERLKAAVNAVGHSAEKVRAHMLEDRWAKDEAA